MPARFSCSVPLPDTYRPGDIIALHRRDPQQLAERVSETSLDKGVIWTGWPALLRIRFSAGKATASLSIDGDAPRTSRPAFEAMVRRMLAADQDVDGFERRFRQHPQVGPLIADRKGLRVPLAATPFEALTWAIAGQQISVAVAISLRRRLIAATAVRHSSGLYCHPDAAHVAALGEAALRQAGFSAGKTATLLHLAHAVSAGELPLDAWLHTMPVAEIRERLLALRGIGPWTVDYVLLRGYGWLDGSLHGDVAVRRSLQAVLASSTAIGEAQAKRWLAEFAPLRALVAAHLWAARAHK